MANKSSMLNTNKVAAIFKKSLLLSGVSLALSFSALAQDEAQTPISIAKLSDARVFADFYRKSYLQYSTISPKHLNKKLLPFIKTITAK